MKFYNIKDEYINYLKKYDTKVSNNKNEQRPYVGVVLTLNDIKYYTPLSSPKPKHQYMKNSKDFRKINGGIYGALNFNNMIPVTDNAIIEMDFNSISDEKYRRLLQNQYKYIKKDVIQIEKIARNLHNLVFTEDTSLSKNDRLVKQRCCNLPLLESLIDKYRQ